MTTVLVSDRIMKKGYALLARLLAAKQNERETKHVCKADNISESERQNDM